MKDPWQIAPPSVPSLILSGIPAEEAERWRNQIHTLRTECGCSMGTYFLVAALVLYAGFWVWSPHSFAALWQALLLGVVILFLALGVGKYTGISLARFKLRRVIRELRMRTVLPGKEHPDG